jgi:hypothetical protein
VEHKLLLDIYNIGFKITGDSFFVVDHLKKDFQLFVKEEGVSKTFAYTVCVRVFCQQPPYERVPPLIGAIYDLGLITYKDKHVNYTDYSSKALMIYDFKKETAELFSLNEEFLYEKSKLTILSRMGELLDRQGIHRLHALGLSKDGKASICLLPMEGGKTTTTLNVLKKDQNIKLLSDDMCLLDGKGIVYPFIMRIGVRDESLLQGLPQDIIEEKTHPKYGSKYFIEPSYFKEKQDSPCRLKNILIGKRIFAQESQIKPVSKLSCLVPCIESGVFGLGLPQLIEFFWRGDLLFLIKRIGIIFARLFLFIKLVSFAKTYVYLIGRDKQASADLLVKFINNS